MQNEAYIGACHPYIVLMSSFFSLKLLDRFSEKG